MTGRIGVPLVKNGLEVTVKNLISSDIHTSIWLSVKNIESSEKPFKLIPGPAIQDDLGNQYESIKVPRASEISQTILYSNSTREGTVFLKD